MSDCLVNEPPNYNTLLNAMDLYVGITDPWEARTLLLQSEWVKQTNALHNCNAQLKGLRDWVHHQTEQETTP